MCIGTKFEESDILSWIRQSLESEKLSNLTIHLTETSAGKNDGFASDIFFATVTGVNENGDSKNINLAVKVNKQNGHADSVLFLELLYKREVLVYNQLFRIFRKFQNDKSVPTPFDAIPKCYKTFSCDDASNGIVVILEDLRTRGYKLHDKTVSMDDQHIRLVLEQYSKFHAISFALRDHNPEVYKSLADKFNCYSEKLSSIFEINVAKISQHLREASRDDLVAQFESSLERGATNIMRDILNEEVGQSVIIHGDGHNNNFMYKYEEGNPKKVIILDWQLAFQHSPVLDLSYFLYQVAGKNINELHKWLEFYHFKLSKNLEEMGTDATNVFPFSALIEHWKKYSSYGFIFTIAFLDLFFIGEGDKITFGDVQIEYSEAYRGKLIPAVDHYCNHEL